MGPLRGPVSVAEWVRRVGWLDTSLAAFAGQCCRGLRSCLLGPEDSHVQWPGRSAVSCSPWLNWDLCVLPCTPPSLCTALPSRRTVHCVTVVRKGGEIHSGWAWFISVRAIGRWRIERAAVIYCQLPSRFCVARLPFVAYLFCGTQCGCQMGLERISSRATKRTSVGERWWQIVGQHIGAAASMRTETFPAALVSAEHLLSFFPRAKLKASDNLSYSQLFFSSSLS